jgi:oligopeptide transport system substrate-binding protein
MRYPDKLMRPRRSKRHWLLAGCILGALLLVACGTDRRGEEFANVLNRSLGPEPESLDVHVALSTQAATVLRDLGEGLTGYAASGELVAAAAQRWQVSADGLEYRFWLRPEARWSNGEAVTAEHFVYSFRRLVDPATASPYAPYLGDIENAHSIASGSADVSTLGITADSRFELAIRLARPVPYFLKLLAHNSAYPVFPPAVAKYGSGFARPGNLVSNGAYKLDEWTMGAVITLSRNEFYWNNAQTAIDRVRHFVTPDETAEVNRYRAGELDITESVSAQMFARLAAERPTELRIAPLLQVYYYGLNLTRPPFKDNPKLRKALSMAIDRETITDKVVGRGELPAYGWVPPGVSDYQPMTFTYAQQSATDRHATARRLYTEAGYSDEHPLQIEIRYNTSETHKNIALAVQQMWRDVLGVETTLINEEFRVLLANMLAREVTQVFRSSWSGDYDDANSFLAIMASGNPSNLPGFSDENYDSLLDRAARQMNPAARQLYLEEAETRLLAAHPFIPIYFYVSKHLVSPRVIGWQDSALDYHYSQHLRLKTND